MPGEIGGDACADAEPDRDDRFLYLSLSQGIEDRSESDISASALGLPLLGA